ncbi:hypothetical protein GCM10010441_01800 [Kitasatospora paracochleata]|uniref:Uncharacterized protein n=1 Tax=Kitasatospora paracochleata TaxID=58354 RepID=A0ABT1J3G2_9ACTN|nr:hypothetical protein [Kitasatospora paracochleata]MCP2311699.1 hypothetical protein [Kitasatospora paracochleata]
MSVSTWLRGATLGAGLALTGYGLYGLLTDPYITAPSQVLVWAVGGLVLHDGLWVPLLCLVGARLVRGPVLRGWLVVAAAVSAVGLPAVLRAGDDHGNPSVLPLPYLRNWLLVLAATAALALLIAVLIALARRWRGSRPISRPAPREDRS